MHKYLGKCFLALMNNSIVYFESAEGLGIRVQDVLSSRGEAHTALDGCVCLRSAIKRARWTAKFT